MVKEKEEIFWRDEFDGKCKDGYFIRCDLFKFVEICEKKGLNIVGIKKPTDWNLEVLIEVKDGKR